MSAGAFQVPYSWVFPYADETNPDGNTTSLITSNTVQMLHKDPRLFNVLLLSLAMVATLIHITLPDWLFQSGISDHNQNHIVSVSLQLLLAQFIVLVISWGHCVLVILLFPRLSQWLNSKNTPSYSHTPWYLNMFSCFWYFSVILLLISRYAIWTHVMLYDWIVSDVSSFENNIIAYHKYLRTSLFSTILCSSAGLVVLLFNAYLLYRSIIHAIYAESLPDSPFLETYGQDPNSSELFFFPVDYANPHLQQMLRTTSYMQRHSLIPDAIRFLDIRLLYTASLLFQALILSLSSFYIDWPDTAASFWDWPASRYNILVSIVLFSLCVVNVVFNFLIILRFPNMSPRFTKTEPSVHLVLFQNVFYALQGGLLAVSYVFWVKAHITSQLRLVPALWGGSSERLDQYLLYLRDSETAMCCVFAVTLVSWLWTGATIAPPFRWAQLIYFRWRGTLHYDPVDLMPWSANHISQSHPGELDSSDSFSGSSSHQFSPPVEMQHFSRGNPPTTSTPLPPTNSSMTAHLHTDRTSARSMVSSINSKTNPLHHSVHVPHLHEPLLPSSTQRRQ